MTFVTPYHKWTRSNRAITYKSPDRFVYGRGHNITQRERTQGKRSNIRSSPTTAITIAGYTIQSNQYNGPSENSTLRTGLSQENQNQPTPRRNKKGHAVNRNMIQFQKFHHPRHTWKHIQLLFNVYVILT